MKYTLGEIEPVCRGLEKKIQFVMLLRKMESSEKNCQLFAAGLGESAFVPVVSNFSERWDISWNLVRSIGSPLQMINKPEGIVLKLSRRERWRASSATRCTPNERDLNDGSRAGED